MSDTPNHETEHETPTTQDPQPETATVGPLPDNQRVGIPEEHQHMVHGIAQRGAAKEAGRA